MTMSRGIGAVDALQGSLPDWVLSLFVAITQLGDVWVFFVVLPPLYWFGPRLGLLDRDRAGLLVGTALTAFALVVALKGAFALPRPPEAVRVVAADGYGFPSGHAIGATAVYGSVALLLDRPSARIRYAGAGALVALVALSRVVLGVHYLVDVVAGTAVGLAVVYAAYRLGRDRPTRVVWAAVVAAGVAVAILAVRTGGLTENAAEALGGTVGAALVWSWLDRRAAGHDVALSVGVGALAVLGGLKLASELLEPTLGLVGVVVANAVIFAGLVGLPGVRPVRDGRPERTGR